MKTKHRPCLHPNITGGSNHSILEGVSEVIKKIAKIPSVLKIRPSLINPAGSGHTKVRIVRTTSFGLNIKIIGNNGCQFFNIVTKNPSLTASAISQATTEL